MQNKRLILDLLIIIFHQNPKIKKSLHPGWNHLFFFKENKTVEQSFETDNLTVMISAILLRSH